MDRPSLSDSEVKLAHDLREARTLLRMPGSDFARVIGCEWGLLKMREQRRARWPDSDEHRAEYQRVIECQVRQLSRDLERVLEISRSLKVIEKGNP